MKIILSSILTFTLIISTAPTFAGSRDYISIVGSSTIYPFAKTVLVKFGKTTKFQSPKIISTGSGLGHKMFGAGVGAQYPDITNSSRRIKKAEFEKAVNNGVREMVEIKIGYDGIVLANSKKNGLFKLTRKDLFLALAARVPNPDGTATLIDNPYKTWKQVDAALPDIGIEVLGPPPTSGTRDAFVELAMEAGADQFDFIRAMKKSDPKKYKEIIQSIREDEAYIESGENDNLIVHKLEGNANLVGIFGFSFLDQNRDKIQGSFVDGVSPDFNAIADGTYPLSRPLFFYVKKAHVGIVPGIKEYLNEFTSEQAWGDKGYLTRKGLIPMPEAERNRYRMVAEQLVPLKLSDL